MGWECTCHHFLLVHHGRHHLTVFRDQELTDSWGHVFLFSKSTAMKFFLIINQALASFSATSFYFFTYIYIYIHVYIYTISFIFILFIWLCRGLSCGRWDLHSLVAAWELLIEMRGIHFPDQGLNPGLGPLLWECGVLATGPPGNSLSATSCQNLTLKCYME